MKGIITAVAWLFMTLPAEAGVEAGSAPPPLELSGGAGGRLDETPWGSAELTNKVHLVFHVDPDLKDLNEHVGEALKAADFPSEQFGTIVVINLSATWKPAWLISAVLRQKQKKYPRAVYVRDVDRALVEQWGLPDQSYSIVLFDREGIVRKIYHGKLDDAQVQELIDAIKSRMPEPNEREAASG